MNTSKFIRPERGFTLVEILIAMVILGTATAGLVHMQISSSSALTDSRYLTTAVTLAQDKMEELKTLARTHPDLSDKIPGNNGTLQQATDSSTADHTDDPLTIETEATAASLGDMRLAAYKRFWNIADNTPCAGSKTVAVIVTWGPRHKRVVLASVL
jgi:prepilin-type N-terminal cleavage/methylation domain-containing protein